MHSTSRRILRAAVFPLLALLFAAQAARAQCPPKTTVASTIYNADGSLASGKVTIAWPSFTIGTCQVIAGQASVSVTAGAFSVQLYPNDAATPAGTSYRVTYALRSGIVSTEYWVVPTSTPPVTIASVRSPTVPVPTVMFSQAQVTNLPADLAKKVELPSPCPSGKFLQSSGSASPPHVNCVDGAGGGSTVQVNGVNLAAQNPVNLQDSGSIVFTNPSAGNVQAALKDSAVTAAKLAAANPSNVQLSGVGDSNIAAAALSPNRVNGIAVVQARSISTTAPLGGGGDLTADRTLTCSTCEVTANKGAASGYASLNSSSKVVQDPAGAQTSPAAAKIPLADGAGKIADGWLSSNVSLLGAVIDDGELGNAYSGVGSCTNQFARALSRNAAPTCATVQKADAVSTFVHTDQANSWTAGVQDMGGAASFVVPKAAGAAPTAAGDLRYDTTQDAWKGGGAGGVTGSIPRVLATTNCTTAGNCTTNGANQVDAASGQQGTTETNFASNWSMPANFLVANKAVQVCGIFEYTTSGSAPTLLLRFKAGSANLYAMAAGVAPSNSVTRGFGLCVGLQGTAAPGASVSTETGLLGAHFTIGNNAINSIAQPVALATNGALTLQFSAQWGTATSGNTVRLRQFIVTELN